MSRGWAEASAPNATAKRGESEISTRAQLTMRDPSAPKTIPSSSRLKMADQNRACRLLRDAIVVPPRARAPTAPRASMTPACRSLSPVRQPLTKWLYV